jgi:hypothetical protein
MSCGVFFGIKTKRGGKDNNVPTPLNYALYCPVWAFYFGYVISHPFTEKLLCAVL